MVETVIEKPIQGRFLVPWPSPIYTLFKVLNETIFSNFLILISIRNLIFEAFLEQKVFVASHYLMSKCRFFLSSLTETIYCYTQPVL